MRKNSRAVDLMLDSGAFSAWNRGTEIDLDAYIQYIKRHEDRLFSYVTLDVLPKGKESARTAEAVEEGARLSARNQEIMKDAGLRPIPVFHQGESFKWLDKMIVDGEEYIGISTRKDLRAAEQIRWLDKVWSVLSDRKGRPLVKTHGFGITSVALLLRYPWFTTDSTTWALSAGYGQILMPPMNSGQVMNYLHHPQSVVVSYIKQGSTSQMKRQFRNMGPEQQAWVVRFIEEEVGLTLTEVMHSSEARRQAILTYYQKFAEVAKDIRFTHHVRTPGRVDTSHLKPVKIDHPNIMFATSFNKQFSNILTRSGARNRLLSYYELKDTPDEVLAQYIETGMPGDYNPGIPKQDWSKETYTSFRRIRLFSRDRSYLEAGEEIYGTPSIC